MAALTQEDGASGGSGAGAGGVVRALRITPDGLLYSASYDLELLAKQLKQLAKELGEGSTGGMPGGWELGGGALQPWVLLCRRFKACCSRSLFGQRKGDAEACGLYTACNK